MNITPIFNSKIIDISDEEYKSLANFVYNNIGINLTDKKQNLMKGRLQKILREKKLTSFKDYYNILIADKSGAVLSDLANAISTNHTYFWRENDHFEFFLKTQLPKIKAGLQKNRTNEIRIWSAGCSSGEESYMLVMLMMEYFGYDYKKLNAGVLGTDISEKALDTAKTGIYPEERMKYIPKHYRNKYFNKLPNDKWEVIDKVKKEVTYRRFNFMNPKFPFKKQFDAIFCRNVMIYFDDKTRKDLVQKFYKLSAHEGYFFIGHSETLNRIKNCPYQYVMPALYQKLKA